jgi:hypothetical protein
MNLAGALQGQQGLLADMDQAARDLSQAFPAS